MDNKPSVTIITPTYNCARFLSYTIRSVMEQRGDFALNYIIIDDASVDGSSQLLNRWNGRYPILVLSHSTIQGEQESVNEALAIVSNKYFMIINADDPLLDDRAIATLVDFMESHPGILCAYPDWHSINEDGSVRAHIKSREYDFTYMVRHHTCLPSVGSIFRREVIDLVGLRDASFRWLGDFDYWLRIGLVGKMARVPVALATWRHRDGQASNIKSDDRAAEHIRVIDKLYSSPDIPDYLRAVEREARCWSYLVAAVVSKSRRKVLRYVWAALRQYPLLLTKLEFYQAVGKRLYHFLRR